MPLRSKALFVLTAVFTANFAPALAQSQHNLILFVPDGLRAHKSRRRPRRPWPRSATRASISPIRIRCSRPSPCRTASGMATGHFLGDTGDFSNTIYHRLCRSDRRAAARRPSSRTMPCSATSTSISPATSSTRTPFSSPRASRAFSTAAIGKLGPTLMFDHTERSGEHTIIVDDSTGSAGRHSAVAGDQRRTGCRRSAAGRALTRRQWQGRRLQDAGHAGRQCRAAGLFRRRRRQGGAADVQGAQQAVRAGVLVARSRRHPAQSGRQPA